MEREAGEPTATGPSQHDQVPNGAERLSGRPPREELWLDAGAVQVESGVEGGHWREFIKFP